MRLDARHYLALALALLLGAAAFMGTQFGLRSQEARVAMSVFLRRRDAAEVVA